MKNSNLIYRAIAILACLFLVFTSIPLESFASEAEKIFLEDAQGNKYNAVANTDISTITTIPTGACEQGATIDIEKTCFVVDVPSGIDLTVHSSLDNWIDLPDCEDLTDKKITALRINAIIASCSFSFGTGLIQDDENEEVKLVVIANNFVDREDSGGEGYSVDNAIILRVGAVTGVTIDRTTLTARITEAQAKNENSYHTSDDRYNGKATSVNGFWADFQTALTRAQTAAERATTQTEIDAAAGNLEAAMANLISTN